MGWGRCLGQRPGLTDPLLGLVFLMGLRWAPTGQSRSARQSWGPPRYASHTGCDKDGLPLLMVASLGSAMNSGHDPTWQWASKDGLEGKVLPFRTFAFF